MSTRNSRKKHALIVSAALMIAVANQITISIRFPQSHATTKPANRHTLGTRLMSFQRPKFPSGRKFSSKWKRCITQAILASLTKLSCFILVEIKFILCISISSNVMDLCLTTLTEWEIGQVKAIDELIRKCQLRYFAFERGHRVLNDMVNDYARHEEIPTFSERLRDTTPGMLRYFLIDLYSALEYSGFLCYCHYRNGNPDYSKSAKNVKFPCEVHKSVKERTAFIERYCQLLFGENACAHVNRERFEEIILKCQMLTEVSADENTVQPDQHQVETLQTLHFLRINTDLHRVLRPITTVQQGWLYFNLQDGSHEIVPDRIPGRDNDPEHWQSFELSPGCWITILSVGPDKLKHHPNAQEGGPNAQEGDPNAQEGDTPQSEMQLVSVAERLLRFVINTRNNLLEIVFPHHEDISVFDEDKVRRQDNGVYIDNKHITWAEFDRSEYGFC